MSISREAKPINDALAGLGMSNDNNLLMELSTINSSPSPKTQSVIQRLMLENRWGQADAHAYLQRYVAALKRAHDDRQHRLRQQMEEEEQLRLRNAEVPSCDSEEDLDDDCCGTWGVVLIQCWTLTRNAMCSWAVVIAAVWLWSSCRRS